MYKIKYAELSQKKHEILVEMAKIDDDMTELAQKKNALRKEIRDVTRSFLTTFVNRSELTT